MTNPRLTTNEITILKELVSVLSRTNTSVRDLEALLLAQAASGPSSQPQTEAPTTSAPVDQFEGEDAAFHFSEIRDGVVNNFSNNHNGRSDGEIYTPPVKGSRAFYRTLISGGSVVSNHSNNNNAQGSVSNPMVVEVSRNLGA